MSQTQQKQQYFKCNKEEFEQLQKEFEKVGVIVVADESTKISRTTTIEMNKDLKVLPLYNEVNDSQSFNRYQLAVIEKYNHKFDASSNYVYIVIERVRTGIF
jgi:hypothetical protein